jgi:hypothetical protein
MEGQVRYWWKADKKEVNKEVMATVKALKSRQSHLYESNKRHLRLYGQHKLLGLRAFENSGVDYLPRLSLNVIQQCVDTAQAKIAKNKPRPRFLTQAGDIGLRRKGEKLGKFVEGTYYQNETYHTAQMNFLEGGVFGTGAMKIFDETVDGRKKVKHERTFIHELTVDEDEAIYGNPKTIYQTKYVNKYYLGELYPKHAVLLKQAARTMGEDDFMISQWDSDTIELIEAWRLPTAGFPNGRHVLCTSTVTLIDEEYKRKKIPFEFFRYRPRILGFFGQGIAEINTGLQIEINKLLRTIQLVMHLGCIPKIFVESTSDIVSFHMNNKIGGIVKFRGAKPTSEQLMNVPSELFLQLDRLYEKSFEQIGLTQMSAYGQKPAELESGIALREYNDIESERFSIVAQDYERFHMNIWKHTIELSRSLGLEDSKYSVTSLGKESIEKINWKDVDLDADSYALQVYPVDILTKNPSGRLADVKTLLDMGLMNGEEGLQLLDFPDLAKFYKLKNAKRINIESTIEKMIDGIYEPPSPMQNLAYGIEAMQSFYLYYKNEGLEIEKLELLVRWVSDALALAEAAKEGEVPVDDMSPEQEPTPFEADEMEEEDMQAQQFEDEMMNEIEQQNIEQQ